MREPLLPLDEPLLELLGAELDDELPELGEFRLFVFIFVDVDEPDGSLMVLLPRPDEPLGVLDELPLVPWSLPLQPTNKAAALAIANSFFIMVTFLLQTVSPTARSLNG